MKTPRTDAVTQKLNEAYPDGYPAIEYRELAKEIEGELSTLRANLERLAERFNHNESVSENGARCAWWNVETELWRVIKGGAPPATGQEWAEKEVVA